VGRAGQLLNNMIKAMGIEREQVYIANIVKCRPPGNRQPEREECETCSPFLMRQIAVVKPKVIVALGATAAKTLLAMNSSMMQLRGRFYDFKPAGVRGTMNGMVQAGSYLSPAFLLRDPRQKGEAWKDLQMVMKNWDEGAESERVGTDAFVSTACWQARHHKPPCGSNAFADSAAFRDSQIVVVLKIEPKLRGQAEILSRRMAVSALMARSPRTPRRYPENRGPSPVHRRSRHGLHELGLQNVSRVNRKHLS